MKSIPFCSKSLFLCCLIGIFSITKSKGQSNGLSFHSHAVVADQRTSLDLFPQEALSVTKNFSLSFEIGFLPEEKDYFGYIFRIIENEKRNIDLIYNKRKLIPDLATEDPNHFKMVIGDRFSKIAFNIPIEQLVNQWSKVDLEFDFDNDQLLLSVNHRRYVETHAHLNRNARYRLLFGANNYPNFKTTDVAPVKFRNIKIEVAGQTKYFWPLNETAGNIAHDTVNNQQAKVTHPLWIRALHQNWKLVKTMKVNGIASVAFNPTAGDLYIIGSDTLWTFSVKNSRQMATGYTNGRFNLLPSNESIYNKDDHTLYNYYVDVKIKTVSTYNFNTRTWSTNNIQNPRIDFWQSNNFFSASDTSLYVANGYGQLSYKNSVFRYHIPSHQWQQVKVKGYDYSPRYLSAGGTTDNGRYAYFLGGYGSSSGLQTLNPKNLYDLVQYDVKKQTFKKIYDLQGPHEDFTFANSLVIDEKTQTFSTLAFSNHEYNSNLQLFTGSLRSPAYRLIGSKIPFDFEDTHSFANLYYDTLSRKFLTVTLLRSDNGTSIVKIFTLSSPPAAEEIFAVTLPGSFPLNYYLAIAILLFVITVSYIYWKRSGIHANKERSLTVKDPKTALAVSAPETTPNPSGSILLFGDLKLYTLSGADITGQFTSLVKELFLAILIYSLKSKRGISPEKLIEFLWPDMQEMNAKNNRAANLSKLKVLLGQMEYVCLSKATGSYYIEIDANHVYVDYRAYLQITGNRKNLNKDMILTLIDITKRGEFLPGTDYTWLDHTKSEITNEIIDIFLQYAGSIKLEEDPEMMIQLANCIFNFDAVNEEAIVIKCQALAYLGKRSLAKSVFQTFSKEYLSFFGEEFGKDFQAILE